MRISDWSSDVCSSDLTLRANSVSSRKPTICDPSLRAMLTSLVDSTKWLLSTRRQNVNSSYFVLLFVMRKSEVLHQIETHRNPASFLKIEIASWGEREVKYV